MFQNVDMDKPGILVTVNVRIVRKVFTVMAIQMRASHALLVRRGHPLQTQALTAFQIVVCIFITVKED